MQAGQVGMKRSPSCPAAQRLRSTCTASSSVLDPQGWGQGLGPQLFSSTRSCLKTLQKMGEKRSDAAGQAIPKLPAEPGVRSLRVNPPLWEGNLNAQAARLLWLALLPLLLPQKFTNAVTYGNGSPESISALLQFVLS